MPWLRIAPAFLALVLLGGVSAAPAATWVADLQAEFAAGTADGVTASDEQGGLTLAFAGENLLRDPGFEGSPDQCPQQKDPYAPSTQPTDGWVHNGLGGREGAITPAESRSGQGAWELADTVNPGEPALLQKVPLKPEYRGRLFAFSVWARTRAGLNDQATIALKFRSTTHWRSDVPRSLTVGPEWRQYVLTAVMPEDGDELGVVIGPSSYEGQGAIIVDDAALTQASYRLEGTWTSPPQSMGADKSIVWRTAYRATTPTDTRVRLFIRTGDAPQPGERWSPWVAVAGNPAADIHVAPGRSVQFRVGLSSSDPTRTPVVESVRLSYGARLAFLFGRVTHAQTGAPIAGAQVGTGEEAISTDRQGEYLLGVPAGPVGGAVTALHYLPEAFDLPSLREGRRLRLDIKLRPDPSWPMFRGGAQRQGYSALSGRLAGFGVAWQYPLGTVAGGEVLPADPDGDGRTEFLLAKGGSLVARRLNGDLIWQVDGWEIGGIKGVYDLLGDGQRQVVTVSEGWQPFANGAFTVTDARSGQVLSRVDTWPDAGDIGHGDTHDYLHGSFSPLMKQSCVVADLDGDAKQEVMVHPNYHSTLMAFDFHDGLTRPRMMWKTQHRFKYDLYLYPLLSADVDGDRRLEIVYHDEDLIRLFDGRTGEEKGAADMGCPRGLFGSMACGDVDADATAEVVLLPTFDPEYTRHTVALADWDGRSFARRWTRDFPEKVRARAFSAPLQAPFADVDGDGRLEVVIQAGADVLVLGGLDGADRYCIPNASLSDAADLDGDGVAEIMVTEGGKTLAYNGQGGFSRKDIPYPPNWGWHNWGDGELSRLRGGPNGVTEVVNQAGKVKAVLPGAPYMTSPIAADLQGDGKVEVLVREATGLIRILDATTGTPKPLAFPNLKCDSPGEMSRGGGITCCDLDHDGKAEIIFRQGGRLTVANADGSIRFRSELGGLSFPAVGRFDGDGALDVACYAGKRWIAFSGSDGKVIWDTPALESNEVATWDVDGDGRDEITGKMGPVFLLSGADGHTLWTAFRREQCALGLGVFADLNGDGRLEALAIGEYTNTAWYPNGRNLWWIGWSSGGSKEHYGAVADVNADGAWDFAISSNHGVLYCVDGRDGHELWTSGIPEKVSLSHCAAADLDGDRKPEFVFGANTGKLIVVNGEDGSLAKEIDFRHPVGEPIVADVNGDDLAEVLVVSDSTLYCLAAGPRPTGGR